MQKRSREKEGAGREGKTSRRAKEGKSVIRDMCRLARLTDLSQNMVANKKGPGMGTQSPNALEDMLSELASGNAFSKRK